MTITKSKFVGICHKGARSPVMSFDTGTNTQYCACWQLLVTDSSFWVSSVLTHLAVFINVNLGRKIVIGVESFETNFSLIDVSEYILDSHSSTELHLRCVYLSSRSSPAANIIFTYNPPDALSPQKSLHRLGMLTKHCNRALVGGMLLKTFWLRLQCTHCSD